MSTKRDVSNLPLAAKVSTVFWGRLVRLGKLVVSAALVLTAFVRTGDLYDGWTRAGYMQPGTIGVNLLPLAVAAWMLLSWRAALRREAAPAPIAFQNARVTLPANNGRRQIVSNRYEL
jgi:hypothetical protein